jgi:plasmid replication initiation protein
MPKKTNVLVKESNTIARAVIYPSGGIWNERIIATLAARNRVDDIEFREQIINAKELADGKSGLSTAQYHEIEKAVDALTKTFYKIRTGKKSFMNYPIFAKIGFDDGYITGKFNPDLKEHYLELKKHFSMRTLPEFRTLSSVYSQVLYRYLNSWKSEDEKIVPLEELHELLATPESLKKNFKDFRRRVLDVAYSEITDPKKINMYFEWEPVKKGLRKVIAIKFCFNPFKSWREKRKTEQAEQV